MCLTCIFQIKRNLKFKLRLCCTHMTMYFLKLQQGIPTLYLFMSKTHRNIQNFMDAWFCFLKRVKRKLLLFLTLKLIVSNSYGGIRLCTELLNAILQLRKSVFPFRKGMDYFRKPYRLLSVTHLISINASNQLSFWKLFPPVQISSDLLPMPSHIYISSSQFK